MPDALSVAVKGGSQLRKRLEDEHKKILARQDKAARAAANVFAKGFRRALPRKTGRLRKHVKVFRVEPGRWKAKVTGHVAHLVLADVAEHEIAPRAMRALGTPRGPRARAMIPAHRGKPELVARVREGSAAEAAQAAREVLSRG